MDSSDNGRDTPRAAAPGTQASGGLKRRRLRVCDSCRQRKIRCDNLPGTCRNCQAYSTPCLITRDGQSVPRSDRPPSQQICINRPSARKSSPTNGQQERQNGPTENRSPILSPVSPISNTQAFNDHISPAQSHVENEAVREENPMHAIGTSPDQTSIFTPLGSTTSRIAGSLQGVVTTEEGRFPKNNKFAGKTSPQVFAKSAEELFKYTAPYIDVMRFFSPTMTFSEQLPTQSFEHCPLVDKSTADLCLHRFFSIYHPLFPILDTKSFHEDYELFYRTKKSTDAAVISCIFLAIALGSENQEISHLHFQKVCSLYGELLAHPYLPCVQALILKAIYLMNTGRDSQALLSIATAVNVAQSIGLHRSLSTQNNPHEFQFVLKEHRLCSCVWWVCYCLEKKLSFELGRPSAINEEDCDADLPDTSQVFHLSTESSVAVGLQIPNFLLYFIDLCRRLSNISFNLFSIRMTLSDEKPVIALMANADTLLVNWRASLPDDLISTSDSSFEPKSELHAIAAGLLNCIYLNAIVAVHRLSLISQSPSPSMATHTNRRIAGSEKICVDAAHALAHETNNLIAGSDAVPRWVGPYAINAIIAIFVSLMKSPRKWSRDVDLALLRSMHHCFRSREDMFLLGRFEMLLNTLIRAVETQTDGYQQSTHLDSQENWTETSPRQDDAIQAEDQLAPHDQEFQLGDLLSSQWNLWNFQLWPLAPLDENDALPTTANGQFRP